MSVFKRVRKRSDGTTYTVWVCEQVVDGTVKTLTAKTKKEVVAKMDKYVLDRALGVDVAKSTFTVSKYMDLYLSTVVYNNVAKTTYSRYRGIYENYIDNSKLGHTLLVKVRYDHIQQFFNELLDLSTPSLNKTKSLLNGCFKLAIKNNLISKNPMMDFCTPKSHVKRKAVKSLTKEQQRSYVGALNDSRMDCVCMMALCCGLRLGEILALKYSDILVDHSVINVTSSVSRTRDYALTGEYTIHLVEKETKTGSSRYVPIPRWLLSRILSYPRISEYVFVTSSGKIMSARNVQRRHYQICDQCQIPRDGNNFHGLRHTYTTRLFEHGVDPKIIQSLLGHSKLSTTMDVYTHVDTGAMSLPIDLDNIFSDYCQFTVNPDKS